MSVPNTILKSPMAVAIERATYTAIWVGFGSGGAAYTSTGGDIRATVSAFFGAALLSFLGRGVVEGHIDSRKGLR